MVNRSGSGVIRKELLTAAVSTTLAVDVALMGPMEL